MMDRTHDGKAFRILTIIDEYTRECLDIVVGRSLRSAKVLRAQIEPTAIRAERPGERYQSPRSIASVSDYSGCSRTPSYNYNSPESIAAA